MSETKKAKSPSPKSAVDPNAQEIVGHFHKLREEQRALVQKVAEIEAEEHEYNVVIQTLDGVDISRRCFRLIGGVLVERTVGDVVPALKQQREQMKRLIETLNNNIEAKGKEINVHREKHGIKIQGEGDGPSGPKKESSPVKKSEGPSGVLVAPS